MKLEDMCLEAKRKVMEKHYKEAGFKTYTYKNVPMSLAEEKEFFGLFEGMENQKMLMINQDNIKYRLPLPDTRSRFKKIIDEAKRRLSNAWYMLKGGDYE